MKSKDATNNDAKLDFGPDYPRRPKFWVTKALRILTHYAAAQDVGAVGFAILVHVVLTEDKRRYTTPPKMLKISLAERLGYSVETISAAIQKCVDFGWLVWHQPHNRSRATTWMTIPEWCDYSVADCDDSDRPIISVNQSVNHPVNQSVNHPVNQSVNHPVNQSVNHPRSYTPTPFPIPTPAPSEAWGMVEMEMFALGIQEVAEPLRSFQANRVPPDLVLGVLRHANEVKLWSASRVRRRLLNLRPGQTPTDPRLWMQPDLGRVQSHPAVQSASPPELRERDNRLRQLEFEFGSELKGLTVPAILERYELPERVRESLRPFPTWEHTSRASSVRLVVLEALASFKQSSKS